MLTPDGRSVITASDSGELAWWDLERGRTTRTIPIPPGQAAIALSPDGATVAVGTGGGIELIDAASGQARTAIGGPAGRPNWLTFSPDAATVASSNGDGTATVWDVASATVRDSMGSHASAMQQSVFGVDGRTLYTIGDDGTAIAWDLTGARGLRRSFPLTDPAAGIPPQPSDPALPPRVSPDGRLIAVGLPDEGVGLWDASELTPSGAPIVPPGGVVRAIAFSPDRRTLAVAADSGEVTIWDIGSRSLRAGPIPASSSQFLHGLAFTPDGSTLVTNGLFGGVQVWDATTLAERGGFADRRAVSDLALSADGIRAAFAQYNGAEVWDLARRELIATVPGNPEADEYSVALSPDGRTLAVGGFGRFVRIWDVGTQALLHELDPGSTGPQVLEFSPDGSTLAAAGTLWDVTTGARIGPVLAAGPETSLMDLSPDGRQLVVTSKDGHAVVWDVDPTSWAVRACAVANRTLTPTEWETFLTGRPYQPACTS
ncbi:MAG TPA: WD40 repeat domain-containing protein [Nakamurella sp.]